MPEKTILKNARPDPNFDHVAYVKDEVERYRELFRQRVEQIDLITDRGFQLLCMFSLIDSMAQDWANYPPRGEQDTFCDFVLKHQDSFDYLNEVEPVTLYYDVEDELGYVESRPGSPKTKQVSIHDPWLTSQVHAGFFVWHKKVEEIAQELRRTMSEDQVQNKLDRHRLIRLIYRMRSKVTHELSELGNEFPLIGQFQSDKPYYRQVGRRYIENGEVVCDTVYELVIPNSFIRNLLKECIDNYLRECIEIERAPFENNSFMRRFRITWYDR